MIKFDHVSKIYDNGTKALDDLDFEILPGDFISIVGKSGAGKSTLLKLIIREDTPSLGTIFIEDIDISRIAPKDIPYLRRKIGVVFQDMKLLPTRTAFENVSYAMEVDGMPRPQIEVEVPQFLGLVGLENKAGAFPDQLSGGEKQRVAIARALAHRPLLLLADEPTGNLDEVNALEILTLLRKINEMGTTIILATHARELVDKIKKRVVVLESGKLVSDVAQGKYRLEAST
ncbi:MAG: cell division ATP-binding protein FtsE [Candidatus Doudnabacteria bacterium RIFCSPHIGHO2_02_FULL_48_21]|uniref:Cell division ATP-binding protein FtsE n=1 Tax=Candidatus Doudnabacteria bacterium RIFCSPLOWO2_02_FULL_48_13 TaxID=1817845 RepID=A0A1F5QA83_9BACT|nr:MAG: cell division ATP-binding protein FtsE [Candidatus Doudnabacteria bacterium RIFCSPHIGHO2_01_48_18]OGE78861.1 MAG: cell division ATP-binding protein FtsE [Candidatus Doudnabacteria bacterium RIFCSPHIGHO2_01_FULL_48_180]OGE91852.1 MAG: cell division ATP-binding protein FtsE [Candidatus Doudnabacteria bacterium RIFCSPHIGHO2_12_FULL_47_25]OGE94089.1 MAG: cell division ATP-binding protein FtsE [Candidatus Doudnabacteria bacterium RIFCSPHIGHO2_02_FULL_48_21]OGE98205.1 MAG: cell division ATP-b